MGLRIEPVIEQNINGPEPCRERRRKRVEDRRVGNREGEEMRVNVN